DAPVVAAALIAPVRPPAPTPPILPPVAANEKAPRREPYIPTVEYVAPENSGQEAESPSTLSPVIVSLWQKARGTARRAEPMALPALALLAVAGLAALLLIIAAMRMAGTLITRMSDEDGRNAGQIIVILPTVTP